MVGGKSSTFHAPSSSLPPFTHTRYHPSRLLPSHSPPIRHHPSRVLPSLHPSELLSHVLHLPLQLTLPPSPTPPPPLRHHPSRVLLSSPLPSLPLPSPALPLPSPPPPPLPSPPPHHTLSPPHPLSHALHLPLLRTLPVVQGPGGQGEGGRRWLGRGREG